MVPIVRRSTLAALVALLLVGGTALGTAAVVSGATAPKPGAPTSPRPGAAAAVLDDPIPQPIERKGPKVGLKTIAGDFVAPVWGTSAPGVPGRLFVVDQVGQLYSVNLRTGAKSVFLDVSSRLVPLGLFGIDYDERGFLGVAFDPQYPSTGKLYTYTSEPVNGPADFSTLEPGQAADHQNVLTEWTVPDPADPTSAPASPRVLLRIDWPQFNHDGGALNFGRDGLLYIALGDGGGADDENPGHGAIGNGQDPTKVLGKILRIDPSGSDSANGEYGIPTGNPFAGRSGYVQEIYAFGFRNPFRFSFDSANGRLYAADVGQNKIEEIDIVLRGGNYGWNVKEGTFCFDPNGTGAGQVTDSRTCGPRGLIGPIAEYDHDEGIAVVGGFVYRGTRLDQLRGRYIFGDYSRTFGANDGRLFILAKKFNKQTKKMITIHELRLATAFNRSVLGFGQDARGEIYVLSNATGVVAGTTGLVQRLVPAQ